MTPEEQAFETLLEVTPETGYPFHGGTRGTPARAARAWADLTRGYSEDPQDVLTMFDADGYDEMVVLRDVAFHSLCEHHLLPFTGRAHVAYVPDGQIVGLSKLARLVHVYARRLQNQERLTVQIADAIGEHLGPQGVAVVVEARHLCMEMRGVKQSGQTMVTSALRGRLNDPEARAEALALMGVGR